MKQKISAFTVIFMMLFLAGCGQHVAESVPQATTVTNKQALNQENVPQKREEAATMPKGFIKQGGLIWMPISFEKNWSDANTYCNNTTINGQTGWRLPTKYELRALVASGAMEGQGWTALNAWSSTAALYTTGIHVDVYLFSGNDHDGSDKNLTPVTCVH